MRRLSLVFARDFEFESQKNKDISLHAVAPAAAAVINNSKLALWSIGCVEQCFSTCLHCLIKPHLSMHQRHIFTYMIVLHGMVKNILCEFYVHVVDSLIKILSTILCSCRGHSLFVSRELYPNTKRVNQSKQVPDTHRKESNGFRDFNKGEYSQCWV